jgi:hypothetical protein
MIAIMVRLMKVLSLLPILSIKNPMKNDPEISPTPNKVMAKRAKNV